MQYAYSSRFLYKQCTETVFAGIALRFLAVYLLKYPYGLFMTLSDTVKRYILIVKFDNIDIAKAFAAAECPCVELSNTFGYSL